MDKGLVIVYTGEGKGKTTAALGLVLRASGYNKRCFVVQFGKAWFTGELVGIKKLGTKVKIIQGGKGFLNILGSKISKTEHKKAANQTYDILYKEVMSNNWDIVVADEIIGAVSSKVLSITRLLQLINDKPSQLDLVLTGHHAPKELIKLADLVTEMREVKHPYRVGILAKKGIDF
ncbi:cob(I)yrinic acid a,c-diamide adenosyltransferase [Candidatus Daviesbacteria bacterium]|nr:cob(I)yrinic acid a,c-diamide adenosyltransferase [Candidatus Daviesbacteria bacterium]